MLNSIYTSDWHLRLARSGPLGPYTDRIAGLLLGQGYPSSTIALKINIVVGLGQWLKKRGHRVGELDEEKAEKFLCYRSKRFKPSRLEKATMRLVLEQLRSSGDIPKAIPAPPNTPLAVLLSDFTKYLMQERGLSDRTIGQYERIVRCFLSERFGIGVIRLGDLCQTDTNDYILRKQATYQPTSLHGMTAALRSFFKFIFLKGDTDTDLATAVPTVACWRLSTVPKS